MSATTSESQFGLQIKDVKWAGGLVLMLVLVFIVDRIRNPDQVAVEDVRPTPAELSKIVPPKDVYGGQTLRLAVTRSPQQYDDMGSLLKTLGPGYGYSTLNLEQLLDKKSYEDLDILFASCSPVPGDWLENTTGGVESRPGTVSARAKPEVIERLKENLRAFVENGGTLYASDWHYSMLMFAFEDFIDFGAAIQGAAQTLTARVVDESLKKVVGEELKLKFDMRDWRPAAFREDKVTVLLRGDYETMDGQTRDAPLLIKFPFGKGTVIFTSHHNEKENSEVEIKLLKFLVFTTMMAKTEATMTETLRQGGFKPAGKSLLSVSGATRSITEDYQSTKSGHLRFSLGFQNGNASMKLTVVGPGGTRQEKEGISPLVVDIPNAGVGTWKYTITAVKTPYDNFPYSLSIGQK